MTNLKKYLMVATMGLLCSALIGCTKTEEIYIDELYQKAYFSLPVYPFDHLEYSETLTKGSYQVIDNQLVNVDTRTTSGTYPFAFEFRTVYNVKKDLTAKFQILPDAEDFIEQYNAENDTEYVLMPAEYYTMTNSVTIKDGSNIGETPFTVERSSTEIPDGQYILPFTCELDDANIELSENRNSVYIVMSYKTVVTDYANEAVLPADYGFTVTNTGATVTNLQNLYDGFTNTTCTMSVSNSSSAVITYEFDQPIALSRIAFVRGGSTQCYMTPAYTYDGETASASLARVTLNSTSPVYSAALPDSDKLVKKVALTMAGTSSRASTVTMGEVYFLVKK